MRYKEFLEYLETNLKGYQTFMEKALAFQNGKNVKRPPAKRWSDEKLNKAAYDMWQKAMEPLYNNLRVAIKSSIPIIWTEYIEKNNVLEGVNDSLSELDFSEENAQ